MLTKKLRLENTEEAISALGVQDTRLRQLEREFKVKIFVRHDPQDSGIEISLCGTAARVDKALRKLRNMLSATAACAAVKKAPAQPVPLDNGVILKPARGRPVSPRTPKQREYAEAIFASPLVVCIGPAGTGKTFLAVAAALRALELGMTDKIVLTRPIVEAGEKLGFLPGDIDEKVHPYLKPLYDSFYSLLGGERFALLREEGVIEIVPLAYMRGRTLENAFIILDEAQNTVPEQMKMCLTRMGVNSRMIVTGDVTQIDLHEKQHSGLVQAVNILSRTPEIKFVYFGKEDVVRHPLVKRILEAYENWEHDNGRN